MSSQALLEEAGLLLTSGPEASAAPAGHKPSRASRRNFSVATGPHPVGKPRLGSQEGCWAPRCGSEPCACSLLSSSTACPACFSLCLAVSPGMTVAGTIPVPTVSNHAKQL